MRTRAGAHLGINKFSGKNRRAGEVKENWVLPDLMHIHMGNSMSTGTFSQKFRIKIFDTKYIICFEKFLWTHTHSV